MTTQEIADRLVELCRQGQNEQAYQELFAEEAVALEPASPMAPRTEGKEALLQKHHQFTGMIQEVHSSYVSDPVVTEGFFAVTMGLDVSYKDGNRIPMDELAIYTVKDGKIVQEEFLYSVPVQV